MLYVQHLSNTLEAFLLHLVAFFFINLRSGTILHMMYVNISLYSTLYFIIVWRESRNQMYLYIVIVRNKLFSRRTERKKKSEKWRVDLSIGGIREITHATGTTAKLLAPLVKMNLIS